MRGYKILLWKAYFDQGYGVTGYLKFIIAFFGLASRDVISTLIFSFIYGLLCFLVGYLWFKYNLIDTEQEIRNRFNPFVKEMRNSVKRKVFK